MVTFPSISTFKDGIFFMISVAVCPEAIIFLSTLNTFLSIPISNSGLAEEVTVTFPRSVAFCSNLIFPRSLSACANICCKFAAVGAPPPCGILSPNVIGLITLLYPIDDNFKLNLPITESPSILNSPFDFVICVERITSFIFLVTVSNLLPVN